MSDAEKVIHNLEITIKGCDCWILPEKSPCLECKELQEAIDLIQKLEEKITNLSNGLDLGWLEDTTKETENE